MKRVRIFVRVLAVLVLLFLFLAFTGSYGLLQPLLILFTGWFSFLARVLPQVTMNWSGIGMVAVCSALVIAAMHWLCQWFYAHWVRHGSPDGDVRWRWTWTASLYGGVWLLFLAAMGVTGVVHQVGWLAGTKERFYVVNSGGSPRYYLTVAIMELTMAGENTDWDEEETRRMFEDPKIRTERLPDPIEDLHVIYLSGPSSKLAAVILFYRDPKKQEQVGFGLVTPDKPCEEFKMDQLPTVLARYLH